jgi:hypothetical protein
VIADCEAHIASGAAIQTDALAETFERHTSSLPSDSQLRGLLTGLAGKLRQDSAQVIAESRLRRVLTPLRQRADDLGRWVEARDAKLKARG